MELSKNQLGILNHTVQRSAHEFFCGDSPDMQKLVEKEFMVSAGRKSFVPDEYFQITDKGREVLHDNR
jgi:hypothetical protein